MSKKIKGHVAHKMTVKGRTYFYIVAPERESVEVYVEWSQPPIDSIAYVQVESIHITPRMLGRHGYLQSVLKRFDEYLSSGLYAICTYCQDDEYVPPWSTKYDVLFDNTTQTALNDTIYKEEKKMRKKTKINGHVVHKLPKSENLYYAVEPENGRICIYKLAYVDCETREPLYNYYGYMNICTKQLGRHGYLQGQINYLAQRYSDNTTSAIMSRMADMAAERIYRDHEKLRKDLDKQMKDLDKIRKALDDMSRFLGIAL